MGLLYGENCITQSSTVFDWCTRVTDGRTDGQTDGLTGYSIYALYSIYAVARKNHIKDKSAKWGKFSLVSLAQLDSNPQSEALQRYWYTERRT